MSTKSPLMQLSLGLGLALSLAACDKNQDATVQADAATPVESEPAPTASAETSDKPAFPDLASALAGAHRSDENRARDASRHPAETLAFFGVERDMKVAELWPGGGWYTAVLAPYLRDEGALVVTNWSTDDERYGGYAQKFADKIAAAPEVYGDLSITTAPASAEEAFELAAADSLDVVLTFRNSHSWFGGGQTQQIYGAAFRALKPGGVFGVVQHRAKEGDDPKKSAELGYLPEAQVVEDAKAAGFELVESSEINANPKDTKDYAIGVWTLPPNFASAERGEEQSPEDKAKYSEIGESDRMTLKFRKPQ